MRWTAGKTLAAILVIDAAAAVAGPALDYRENSPVYLAIAQGVAAVVTFIGLLDFAARRPASDFGFREVIAGTLIVVYVLLVTATAFFSGESKLPSISQQLLTSFTTVVSLVIAFYFGVSAVEKGAAAIRRNEPADRHSGDVVDRAQDRRTDPAIANAPAADLGAQAPP